MRDPWPLDLGFILGGVSSIAGVKRLLLPATSNAFVFVVCGPGILGKYPSL